MNTVDPRVIEIALSRVGGTDFENFTQGFFASTLGTDYVPMGGVHDGGTDGALGDRIFEATGTQKFMQASITAAPKPKIKYTVSRLRRFGRDPISLIYATSQKLTLIDKIQEELSDELNCRIVVRDGRYFQHQINGTPGALLLPALHPTWRVLVPRTPYRPCKTCQPRRFACSLVKSWTAVEEKANYLRR